jgi:hypothetical protein
MRYYVYGAVALIVFSVIFFARGSESAPQEEALAEMMNTEEEYVWQPDGTSFPADLPDRSLIYFSFLNKCDPTEIGGLRPYIYLQYKREERQVTVFTEEASCKAYDGIGYYKWNGSMYGEILIPFDVIQDRIQEMIDEIAAKYPELSGFEQIQ